MPTVPRYDEPQVRTAPIPGARFSADAPAEAFGGGASTDRMFDAARQLGETIKRRADQVAVLDADGKLSEMETRLQYDPETGAMKRKGKDALGLPDEIKTSWDKGLKDIMAGLSNGDQRMALQAHASARWASLNDNIQRHVSTEINNFDAQATESYIANEREAAAANFLDVPRVDMSIARQKAAIQDHAARNGMPSEWIQQQSLAAESKTRASVIGRMLDADMNEAAKAKFDSDKAFMTSDDQMAVRQEVEKGVFRDEALKTWNDVSGDKFLRPDGTFDLEKQRDAVFARTDIPTDKKEQLFDYVKSRTDEAHVQLAQTRNGIDRAFMNDLYDARKGGAPMDDALKLADKYGYDSYDTAVKEKAVKELYTQPGATDPGVYMSLWENIRSKTAGREDIDNAFARGQINRQNWEELRKDYWNSQFSAETPDERAMRDRIKMLAESTFGTDKDEKGLKRADEFTYTVQQMGRGKPPEQQWKIANDLLKETVVNPRDWWFDKTAPAWQEELKKDDAQNAAWGQFQDELGPDVVKAIGRSALISGRQSWGLPDVQGFVNDVGGPEAVKIGTPVNNAIRFLIKRGRLVTPDTVRKLLESHRGGASGNF